MPNKYYNSVSTYQCDRSHDLSCLRYVTCIYASYYLVHEQIKWFNKPTMHQSHDHLHERMNIYDTLPIAMNTCSCTVSCSYRASKRNQPKVHSNRQRNIKIIEGAHSVEHISCLVQREGLEGVSVCVCMCVCVCVCTCTCVCA